MGFRVIGSDDQVFRPPSWRPDDPGRLVVELRGAAGLRHSQANLWRYPPGGSGRRHREPIQEEVFCVVEGTLSVYLGESPERFVLGPRSIVVVEPGTAVQLRNESADDVVFFAYGAPSQPADYQAELLDPQS